LGGIAEKKKIWFTSGVAALLIVLILVLLLTNVKHYAPLYSNVSASEAGQITDALNSQKVPYKLSNGGTTISVPENQVNQLKVSLAAQGIPKTGQIDYSFFGQNAGFGMTDKQFDVLQRAAMQTELANLISNSKGVKSAKVMITLPPADVWVSNQGNQNQASASVVLNVDPGYQLSSTQVKGLYHLISKSVPNLPENNIVIMDQYYDYYDLNSGSSGDSTMSAYQTQQQITRDVENNIQRRVTQMLTTMVGQGKVLVNVTANVDMTNTKEKQDLVLPVNQQTMEGLQTSTEHIAETYNGAGAAGQVGTGTSDVPTYQAGTNGNGNYQKVQDRVNYEFDRIHKDITHSPYKVTDLGIQVLIEPPVANNVNSLSQQRVSDVKNILNSVVQTSISDNQGQEIPIAQVNQKTYVSVGRLNGQIVPPTQAGWGAWPYVIGGTALAAIAGTIIWLIVGKRRKAGEKDTALASDEVVPHEDELAAALNKESPEKRKYNELEKLARQKPDDFVRLLRGWMSDDR
jgi:flagellar basal-body M-ring protein/flagellar hook-basal body protein (fliF)